MAIGSKRVVLFYFSVEAVSEPKSAEIFLFVVSLRHGLVDNTFLFGTENIMF